MKMAETATDQGWLAARFGRASTGLKMFFFLSLGLLPLGLIAILASIETARENQQRQITDVRARLELKAERIDSALSRSMLMLRAAAGTMGATGWDQALCSASLDRIARAERLPGRFAIHAGGIPRCMTGGFMPGPISGRRDASSALAIDPGARAVRFAVFDEAGMVAGSGELSAEQLARLTDLPGAEKGYRLELTGAGQRLLVRDTFSSTSGARELAFTGPIAGGMLQATLRTAASPLSAAELLTILLPVLMWVAAAIIGWIIVDRLLLKPLTGMQRAIAAYQPGDTELALPTLRSPAREIGDLGLAFARVTETVARHEADLEAGLERQKRLVREVHHRVKNNLQVVASLLNLHARGATSEDASAAYASIQRRVDALAVVHRNHYAELEENRGVALRSLLSELGANLRANAPKSAAGLQIRLAVEPVHATQDVAVPVAFLVTELVEFAMFCGGRCVTVTIEEVRPGTASLIVESDALQGELKCDEKLFERFDRIVTGLSRQLRSVIQKDNEIGRYALELSIVPNGEA
jgi:two-component sensor histidine kinase